MQLVGSVHLILLLLRVNLGGADIFGGGGAHKEEGGQEEEGHSENYGGAVCRAGLRFFTTWLKR